jgi:hypothetical protein
MTKDRANPPRKEAAAPVARSVTQKEEMAASVQPLYDKLRRDPVFNGRSHVDRWTMLLDRLAADDASRATFLRTWPLVDADDLMRRLEARNRPPVRVWEFRRELRCWLLENALDCELIVDLNDRRYRHERYATRSQAIARAEQLRQQILSTNRWSDDS